MAVDTRNKRGSILGLALAASIILPNPDAAINAGDRRQTAHCYVGFDFTPEIDRPANSDATLPADLSANSDATLPADLSANSDATLPADLPANSDASFASDLPANSDAF